MTKQLPLNTAPLPLKLRIEDYLLLDRSGAFDAYAKTELIDGNILFMNGQHRPHALLKMRIYDALRDGLRQARSDLTALVKASIAMPDNSAPEPDIVVTSEPLGEGLVPLGSVALIVEIADTSLELDLGRKAMLYARHGVAEYWVADVRAHILHMMCEPAGEGYQRRRERMIAGSIDAYSIAGLRVTI